MAGRELHIVYTPEKTRILFGLCVTLGGEEGRKRARVKKTGQSQIQLTTDVRTLAIHDSNSSTSFDQLRGSSDTLPTFTSELTSASLAQLERSGELHAHHEQLEVQMRTAPSRRVAADGGESELEISQKTCSAYETLPRGLTRFGGEELEEYSDQESQDETENIDRVQLPLEDIDTLDNDTYSTVFEIESLRKPVEIKRSRTHHLRPLPAALQRVSTISTTSSGSGYVISSLNSPVALTSPRERDRTSSVYSTGSGGYVINSLEWANSRPAPPPVKPPFLPVIEEHSPSSEYLHIIPS